MHYYKIIFIFIISAFLSSCGKPPLFNKLEKPIQEISETIFIREIAFKLTWIVPPTVDEMSSFELEFIEDQSPGLSVNAYIDMPEMGHGSSPIVISKNNESNYLFTEVSFFMTGLWVLHIDFLENNKVIYKWQKSYTVL